MKRYKVILKLKRPKFDPNKKFFSLDESQMERISKWKQEHDGIHIPKNKKTRYSGAIGGAYTYKFTPTSIGTVVKVVCSCEKFIDVSDYDDW